MVPACECKRQKEVRLLSCGCQLQLRLPGGFVWRRRGRRRHLVSPKRRHLLPLLFLGCLGCLGCPLASSATTPLAFRRRLDVVSTGFSAGCPYRHRALAITATAVRAKRDADLLVASRFAMHTTGRWRGKGGRASGYKHAVLLRALRPLGGHQGCDGPRSLTCPFHEPPLPNTGFMDRPTVLRT